MGSTEEILVEGKKVKDEFLLCGRNRGGKMVFFPGKESLISHIVPVNVKKAHLTYLVGCRV